MLIELGQNGLFHQVGEFVDDEAALLGIFIFRKAPLPVDDHLDGQGTAHRFFREGVVMASSKALVCRLLQLS
jgi:hypothetical protein